ncbi:MAG: FG-GAP repeat domain-containing protein, partial [bacterium]
MKKRLVTVLGILALGFMADSVHAQLPDGKNEYNVAMVNPRFLGSDTLDSDAGRGVWVAQNPDLDNDGLPEILVTEYSKGGRVFVFEVVGDNTLEFVWASKALTDSRNGGGSTPRSVTTGDFDNDGNQEIV